MKEEYKDARRNWAVRNAIMAYILEFTKSNGKAPAQREIAKALGISLSVLNGYLVRMKRDGLIRYEAFIWRTLSVVDSNI